MVKKMLYNNSQPKLIQFHRAIMTRNKIPRLLLFDIDATLIKSEYRAGAESYICKALSITFEREVKRNGIEFAGGTDGTIAADLLGQYGVTKENCPDYDEKVEKSFNMMPKIMEEGIKAGSYRWKSLLNANEILTELSTRADVKLAILTGNHRVTAQMKLENAGINTQLFKWGSFGGDPDALFGSFGGSDDPVRNKLVGIARARYRDYLGVGAEVGGNDMLVIGDTPKDIECAHVNDVPCVAVDSGNHTADDLSSAECVLRGGFADLNAAVEAMVKAPEII